MTHYDIPNELNQTIAPESTEGAEACTCPALCAHLAKVTIAITSYNRLDDLRQTLAQISGMGLDPVSTLVLDDGSPSPLKQLRSEFPHVRFVREEQSLGLIVERNRMASMIQTPYLLSLDDDSCVMNWQSVCTAVRHLEANPHDAVVAFVIVEGNVPAEIDLQFPLRLNSSRIPTAVSEFGGGANIMRVETFRQLDGFRGFFFQMGEERDFSLRLYRDGYRVVALPGCFVFHRRTPVNRSSKKLLYYRAQNTILMWGLNLPREGLTWQLIRSSINQLMSAGMSPSLLLSVLLGLMSGFGLLLVRQEQRRPMSMSIYKFWRSLPGGPYLFFNS